jgi:hypothetical protein
LITTLSVHTQQLLLPLAEGGHENDVDLQILVELKPNAPTFQALMYL